MRLLSRQLAERINYQVLYVKFGCVLGVLAFFGGTGGNTFATPPEKACDAFSVSAKDSSCGAAYCAKPLPSVQRES